MCSQMGDQSIDIHVDPTTEILKDDFILITSQLLDIALRSTHLITSNMIAPPGLVCGHAISSNCKGPFLMNHDWASPCDA